MSLPTVADDRARIREWRTNLERWRELLVELYADGVIETLEEFAEYFRAPYADLVIERFYDTFTDRQLESVPRALKAGAKPEELLALRVCGFNCEGEDLTVISLGELHTRIETTLKLEQRGDTSAWLAAYAGLLAAESRRRRTA